MDSPNGPRILVVAEFGPGSAGGSWIILKHLFRGQDWNQIYWWSFVGAPGAYQMGGRHHSFNLPTKMLPQRRFTRLKACILENFFVPRAARQLQSFIESVRPDFILVLAHGWTIPVAYRVMPQFKAHLHVSVHDMPDTLGNSPPELRRTKENWMKLTEILYRRASSRDVIGQAMAEELRRRTGVECTNLFRCAVEPETLSRLPLPTPTRNDNVIRIGYAGTIIAEETFSRFVTAARAAGECLSRKVEIHLYSWHSYCDRSWFDPGIIIERGARTEDEIHREYQTMTWGLVLMHLADIDPRYNRFSFPCKFTTALAASLPLICIGHHESALIELARRYDLGLLLTDQDEGSMADRLAAGLTDFSRFDHFRREGARCAEAEFNAERNREKFRPLLSGVNKEA